MTADRTTLKFPESVMISFSCNRFIIVAAIIFAAFFTGGAAAHAQCEPLNPPPGLPSAFIMEGELVMDFCGPVDVAQSEGDAEFLVYDSGDTPCRVSLEPYNLTIHATTPFGLMRAELDPLRQPSRTTIIANQTGAPFPATATVSFYMNITFDGLPGEDYRTVEPVTFVSRNVNTFPFFNEVFVLDRKVRIINIKGIPDCFFIYDARMTFQGR